MLPVWPADLPTSMRRRSDCAIEDGAPSCRQGGMLDANDGCPAQPEDTDGFEDEDGCPDPDNDGDGVLDRDDKCPAENEDMDGFKDEDGCPDLYNDGDGISGGDDKCPFEDEDVDGFEDTDGCPDPDNDGDRIPDSADKCPDEKETLNGVDDDDGCPDEGSVLVELKESIIDLKHKIRFRGGSDQIVGKMSIRMLEIVVSVLKTDSSLKLRIEDHTDSKGSREKKLELSKQRTEAVKRYMVERGIDSARLESVGYGQDKPVGDTKTKKGRAASKRVELHIVE